MQPKRTAGIPTPWRRRSGRRPRLPWPWLVLAVLGVILALSEANLRDGSVPSGEFHGYPTRIVDGDTFDVAGVRIRLHGVDAPEMDTAAGPLARQAMVAMIDGRNITCLDNGERSYERVVASCRDEEGADLGERLVSEGWALDAPRFSGGRYQFQQWRAQLDGRGMHAN